MKLLLDIEAPGLENFHIQEPAVQAEIGAFTKKLVRSRTRGPEPKVSVLVVEDDSVVVRMAELFALQAKATALKKIVFGTEAEVTEAVQKSKALLQATQQKVLHDC